jgi:hypothetical protein
METANMLKKMKNTKIIIAGYSPNRNWWNLITAAKFVQPIPIFLAYLVPLDVDVVPIKFHQFLFGE